jgi:hypothetical protein
MPFHSVFLFRFHVRTTDGECRLMQVDDGVPMALSGILEVYWRKELTVTVGKPFRVKVEGLNHREAIDAAVEQVTEQVRAILLKYQEPVVKISG